MMSQSEFRQDSYFHILIGDVVAAKERLQINDSPTHRRELIRTIFAAIEGLHWRLKQDVLSRGSRSRLLSPHEHAALQEETYNVDERGGVRSSPRFIPLVSSIRLVIEIVKRYQTDYQVDLNHQGWTNLRATVKIRNRLVHPKRLEDLLISEQEVSQSLSAFYWLLALVLEATHKTNSV